MSNIKLQIGLDVIRSYRRLAYSPWYALAEFIDNSTQSYRNNEDELNEAFAKEGRRLRVRIEYDRDADLLIVTDNAMGMNLAELERALFIGKPPIDLTGRSQFGLGLKTAACWFGDTWSVRTKKLGERQGYRVLVEVEKVASAPEYDLPTDVFDAPVGEHFTEIRIENLHQVLQGRRLGKTRDSLRSMYRVDIRRGKLELVWDTNVLTWRDENEYLPVENGDKVVDKLKFSFEVGGRRVRGWAGVLAPGSSSRGSAGFALIRRGRLIRGWPVAWRPEAIFGPSPGRNDLVNQRVTGEVVLDDFDVTHTKDDILWPEDEEDEVQEGIKERIAQVLKLAREYRHAKAAPEPVARDRKQAMDGLVGDSSLGQRIQATGREVEALIDAMPPSDIAAVAAAAMARVVGKDQALLQIDAARHVFNVFTTSKQGPEAPYVSASEGRKNAWLLVLNAAHPLCVASEDDEALRVHIQHAVADGLVVWALEGGRIAGQGPALLGFKDALLRLMSRDP
jgi:hypothetical protein